MDHPENTHRLTYRPEVKRGFPWGCVSFVYGVILLGWVALTFTGVPPESIDLFGSFERTGPLISLVGIIPAAIALVRKGADLLLAKWGVALAIMNAILTAICFAKI